MQEDKLQKPYITENEINLLNQKKELINRFCQGIKLVSFPPTSEQVTQVVFEQIPDFLGHYKVFNELFVQLFVMSDMKTRTWALYTNEN